MSPRALKALKSARGAPLLCVGDVMLDRYVYGDVARVSPEAPVPVLLYDQQRAMPGGAANVAVNAALLGADVRLLGLIGRDEAGETLKAVLASQPGVDALLIEEAGRFTTEKSRFIGSGQQVMRLDREVVAAPSAEADKALADAILSAGDVRAILVSDYGKGAVTDGVLNAVGGLAAGTGAVVLVDPAGPDFGRYGEVDLIKPNASELGAAVGGSVGDDGEASAALAAALDRFPAKAICVTRAERGLSTMARGEGVQHVKGRARTVFDVSGAGDTSLAALGVAFAGGGELYDAAQLAVAASGLVVEKAGTAAVSAQEVSNALMGASGAGSAAGATIEGAAAIAADWRKAGLKVGFSNGCFDLLHRGHVAVLAAAKAACDRLIVGLNSDASVRRLKGAGRPVNTATDRAAVLLGLAAVDAVAVFEDDTPLALIEAIEPDVLVKGGDYSEDEIVGAGFVRARGGDVLIAPLVEGQSTTAQIARAAEKGSDSD
ncbi:MAG: D-glycero-beta-D-manno-heptose 1-phosphate adenylyltransferase [Pseudomonadota bacterium]